MRSLFDEIVDNGEAVLERLVSQAQQESVQLDFKCKRTATNGMWEKEDQRVLAKALSAFSNSMGGLIIFGVDARPGPDGIDAAVALQPVADVAAFASQAQSLCGQLLMPRHDGIFLQTVPSVKSVGSGYLAIWVERSDRRPHRSEAAGDKQYYKRSGDSSFAMEHYDIEDAFNRLAPAELVVGWSVSLDGSMTSGGKFTQWAKLILSLTNESRVSAALPYLRLSLTKGAGIDPFGLDGNGSHGLPRTKWDPKLFSGGADDAVHPAQTLPITALKLDLTEPVDGSWMVNGNAEDDIEVDYEYGCANGRLRTGKLVVTLADLKEAAGLP